MNRRQFLKSGAMLAAAVAVAPAVVAETMKFHTGGIIDANTFFYMVGERLSCSAGYWLVSWPEGNHTVAVKLYEDAKGTAWMPDEVAAIKNKTCAYFGADGTRYGPNPI